jgi:carboxylesterase type B
MSAAASRSTLRCARYAAEGRVRSCLRAVPAEELVLGVGPGDVSPWVGGRVLPKTPLELIGSDTAPVTMLVGSNREEAAFWFANDGVLPGDRYPPADRYRDTNELVGPQNGAELRSLYPVDDYASAFWATIAAVTDAVYTCPIRRLALANQAPVYRYLYTHAYDNSPDPVITAAGAAHFFDEPVLWHDADLLDPGYQFSADECGSQTAWPGTGPTSRRPETRTVRASSPGRRSRAAPRTSKSWMSPQAIWSGTTGPSAHSSTRYPTCRRSRRSTPQVRAGTEKTARADAGVRARAVTSTLAGRSARLRAAE